PEISNYVTRWLNGEVSLNDVSLGVSAWLGGCEPDEIFQPNEIIEAESGKLSGSMIVGSSPGVTYIYSPIDNLTSHNGLANYTFEITQEGNYYLEARVLWGGNGSRDSFFVVADGDIPADDAVFDFIQNSSFSWENVSWRAGNPGGVPPAVDPKTW